MFLLDYNTCLLFLEGSNKTVADYFRGQRPSLVSLSSMVKAQLLAQARSGNRVEERLETLQQFLEPVTILPFDDRCAEEYGQIKALLNAQNIDMPGDDLINAATARANDATLVTATPTRFNNVSGLRLSNWCK